MGCGDGVLLYLLSTKVQSSSLYGVDSSKLAVEAGKKQLNKLEIYNIVLKIQDAYNLNFQDNSFDFVISTDVIEHLKNPGQMLLEIKRVLKPNGIAIIGTPIKITEVPLDKNHQTEFFQGDFTKMLTSHFKQVDLIKTHDLFYHLIYQKYRIIRYLFNFLSILGSNPFLKNNKKHTRIFVYMVGVCSNPRKN